MVKNPPASAGYAGDAGWSLGWEVDPWVAKIPWRRKWPPTPVFLPGKSYGQRNMEGCSPWGRRELDTTKQAPQIRQKSKIRSMA